MSGQEGVKDPFVKIRAFRKQHKLTYPLLSDEEATIISKFGFDGIPANVVIDEHGKYIAATNYDSDLVDQLVTILNKRKR